MRERDETTNTDDDTEKVSALSNHRPSHQAPRTQAKRAPKFLAHQAQG